MWITLVCIPPALAGSPLHAQDDDEALSIPLLEQDLPEPIVGGRDVRRGDWRDVARITLANGGWCSGTLISPRVVLTAGHCVNEEPPVDVLIGATHLRSTEGEHLGVAGTVEYPDSQTTYDVGLVFLDRPSRWEPRGIALGCVLNDGLFDGARAESVGWGAVDPAGVVTTEMLQELRLSVTDADCRDDPYCREPGGEIFGGGEGTGPCFGDSGGPLYLLTDAGDFVVGVESRVFEEGNARCGNGAIWVRPDAVIRWIEDEVDGAPLVYPSCNQPPTAGIDPIETHRNQPATADVVVTDPDGSFARATLAVAQPPEHGTVEILAGHRLLYTPDRGWLGEDPFTLTVTDEGTDNARTGQPTSVDVDVPVTVRAGFLGVGCSGVAGAPTGWVAVSLALILSRRRPGADR